MNEHRGDEESPLNYDGQRSIRILVASSKHGVELCRLLAVDARLPRLQGLQWGEGDTETLCSHGWSSSLQVLVPDF